VAVLVGLGVKVMGVERVSSVIMLAGLFIEPVGKGVKSVQGYKAVTVRLVLMWGRVLVIIGIV
jgi:hypothetical protein